MLATKIFTATVHNSRYLLLGDAFKCVCRSGAKKEWAVMYTMLDVLYPAQKPLKK